MQPTIINRQTRRIPVPPSLNGCGRPHPHPNGHTLTVNSPVDVAGATSAVLDSEVAVLAPEQLNSWQRVAAALRQARRAQWTMLNATGLPPEWLPGVDEVVKLPAGDDPWTCWEAGGMLGLGAAVWEADLTGGTGSTAAARRQTVCGLGAQAGSPLVDLSLYVRPAEMPRLLRLPFLLWPLPARDGSITFVHAEPFLERYLPLSWRKAFAREYDPTTKEPAHFVLAEPAALWRLLKHYLQSDFFSPLSHVQPIALPKADEEESTLSLQDQMAALGDLPAPQSLQEPLDDQHVNSPAVDLDHFDPERHGFLNPEAAGQPNGVFSRDFLERGSFVPIWCDLATSTVTVAGPRPVTHDAVMRFEDFLREHHKAGGVMGDQLLTLTYLRADNAQVERFFRAHRQQRINTDHLISRVYEAVKAEGRDEIRTAQSVLEISDEDIRSRAAGQGSTPDATHLLRDLLRWGVTNDASDFHLSLHAEPPTRPGQEPRFFTRARYTIDGELVDHPSHIPGQLAQPLVGALKAQAGISSGTRLLSDRDGYFAMRHQGYLYEVRVVVIPNTYDELIVCRFQNASTPVRPLRELGVREHENNILLRSVQQKQGLILVCGATGAGKTNTLWAMLEAMPRNRRNVLTIERPVERKMLNVEQIVASDEFGFGNAARSMMRAAPNVVVVGETRDMDTVDPVCYLAETGHLVLTTVHANTAASAASRLINIAPSDQRDHLAFRIAEALTAVEAQMLVPTLCRCAQMRGPIQDEELWQRRIPESMWDCFNPLRDRPFREKNAEGCPFCRRNPGERGRTGLFEVFWVDEDIRSAVRQNAPQHEIRKLHAAQYVRDRQSALGMERARQVGALKAERASDVQIGALETDFANRAAGVGKVRSAQSVLGQAVEKVQQGRVDLSRAVGLLAYER